MPVLYQPHNNSQVFINVCILPTGIQQKTIKGADSKPAEVPSGAAFRALVDTGATASCITTSVAEKIGLKPIGKVPIQGVDGVADHNNYLFHIGFFINISTGEGQQQGTLTVLNKEITGAEIDSGGAFDVLLGMDVLPTGQLIVSGNGQASFSF